MPGKASAEPLAAKSRCPSGTSLRIGKLRLDIINVRLANAAWGASQLENTTTNIDGITAQTGHTAERASLSSKRSVLLQCTKVGRARNPSGTSLLSKWHHSPNPSYLLSRG
jgi:hypothetical protein